MLAAGETKMSFNESGVLKAVEASKIMHKYMGILPPVFIQSEMVTACDCTLWDITGPSVYW